VLNPAREAREVTLGLDSRHAAFRAGKNLWQGKPVTADGNTIKATVGGRDAAVIRLQ
jgi:hypothetical protein